MRIELRQDKVLIDGYVNAVARDSRPIPDTNGERFVEQIMPGAFARALERAKASNRAIDLLLDHEENRKLGDTNSNVTLVEDNIGLRAICEITDPEVMQKAREGKLRGWSFGFMNARAQEEDAETDSFAAAHEPQVLKRFAKRSNMFPVSFLRMAAL